MDDEYTTIRIEKVGDLSCFASMDVDIHRLADRLAQKIGNAVDSAILEDPAIVEAIERRGWHRSFGCKYCTPRYQDAPAGDYYSLDFSGGRHKGSLTVRCDWEGDNGIGVHVLENEIGTRWTEAFVRASYCPFCGCKLG